MTPFKRKALPAAILSLTVGACGGGGGGGGGDTVAGISDSPQQGISGSGLSTSGTIDGFGSIFVNGVEFETDDAEIVINGRSASEADLRIGMVVLVSGEVNDDGATGAAQRVIFDNEIKGPISAITPGRDDDAKLITILGIDVIVERTGTVFDDVTYDTLAVDDVVEVSGFADVSNKLRATRVEKESTFVAGQTEVEVKGVVQALAATQFNLGDFVVDYSNADLSELDDGELAEGLGVEVHGTVSGLTITATWIDDEDDITDDLDDDDDFSLQGPISNFVSPADFEINGVKVDATDARRIPAGLRLANGVVIEAEGFWNGQLLRARSVEARRGRIEIEAAVSDVAGDRITLGLFGGSVTVQVTSRTLFDDDTDRVDNLTLMDIGTGDFLEVEALVDGDTLFATRIDRDDPDDEVIQAPVEAFNAGSDITLLGITYSVAGAEFESFDDVDISAEAFFSQLQIGDLVKVEDDEIADGIADEVEFELDGRPDGGFEFDDDDDSDDDDSDDDDSDDDDSGDDDDGADDSNDGVDDSDDGVGGSDDGVDDSDDTDDSTDDAADDSDDDLDDGSDDD